MALKDIVDRSCGGNNPILKLTSHYASEDYKSPLELANEFAVHHGPARQMAPQTFNMEELMQEVAEMERSRYTSHLPPRQPEAQEWLGEYFREPQLNAPDQWANDFLREQQSMVVPLPAVAASDSDPNSLWAHEYLDLVADNTDEWKLFEGVFENAELAEEQKSASELSLAARDFLQSVDDPKFANSQFFKYLENLGNQGEGASQIPITRPVSDNVVSDDWSREFTEFVSQPDGVASKTTDPKSMSDRWVNEFVGMQQASASDLDFAFDDIYENVDSRPVASQMTQVPNNAVESDPSWDEWSKEFKTINQTPAPEDWTDQFENESREDFWTNLQNHWNEIAKQDSSGQHEWLTNEDLFNDDSIFYKDYKFEEDNPLKDISNPFEEGLERLKQGDIPNAVLLFEAAVQKNPKDAIAWQYLGTTQASNEQDSSAIAALKRCVEIDPENLTAYMSLAVSYTNESLQQPACKCLMEWLSHNPVYSHIVRDNAIAISDIDRVTVSSFMSKEYHQQLTDMYLKAVQTNLRSDIDPDVQIGLGVLFNLGRDFDKAVDCFSAALQFRPQDFLIWNKLGASLAQGSRNEEAVDAFRHALQLAPGYIRTRYNIGVACINLGAYRESLEHFLSALKLQKSSRGPTGNYGYTSDNIWSSVRKSLTLFGRTDLHKACDARDIDLLSKEFINEP